MNSKSPSFLPALDYHWLTPWYDLLLRTAMPERRMRSIVLDSVASRPGRILDIGCGTGTQLRLTRAKLPAASAIGIDVDERILRLAQRKLISGKSSFPLTCASAVSLPFSDKIFDNIISMLVLHHLTSAEKRACIGEAFRVLRMGGELHVADFGAPGGHWMRVASRVSTLLEDRTRMRDNVRGLIPEMCHAAGFHVRESASVSTIFGTVRMLVCRRPESH